MKLEPWQKRFWREALDDWRSVVLIVARKNGKTSMLAAYALYELVHGTAGRRSCWLLRRIGRRAGCSTLPPGSFAGIRGCRSGCASETMRGRSFARTASARSSG